MSKSTVSEELELMKSLHHTISERMKLISRERISSQGNIISSQGNIIFNGKYICSANLARKFIAFCDGH